MDNIFGGGAYTNFYNYMKNCDIIDFKQHPYLTYMTEHLGDRQIMFANLWLKEIYNLNMISEEDLTHLINVNDKYGNPKKYQIAHLYCSPNTIKYIYFGLLNIKTILQKNIENFNFIEIGGGYGGQCIILQELFKKFNISVEKYILIDLDAIVDFQKKYIDNHIQNNNCVFISCLHYAEHSFSEENFLFSSYSLAELDAEIRDDYYKKLLPHVQNGFIVWNNIIFDFPLCSVSIPETPQTAVCNKFIYF